MAAREAATAESPSRARAASPRRQQIRKALLLVSFLSLPITLNYFSPYLIIDSASQGIVNGSFITFGVLFVSSLFVGRLWCGWACPAAGLQEMCTAINGRRAGGGKSTWIKWAIWIPWVGSIAALAFSAGGYHGINPFYMMDSGISVDRPQAYVMYYTVAGLFVILPVVFGRRAGCHYLCWMAPFMIIGSKIRGAFGWPALRLRAETAKCGDCKKCTQNCPMSLDVNRMVQTGTMGHSDCSLCGTCVDGCPKGAIRYTFSTGKQAGELPLAGKRKRNAGHSGRLNAL